MVVIFKLKKNKKINTGACDHDTKCSTRKDHIRPEGEPEVQPQNNGIQIIPLNHQPQIASPHDMNRSPVHHMYPFGPYFLRPHLSSTSSDHSSAPTRKSSGGYESVTGSGINPCTFSPCATHHYSRGACNCEIDGYHCCHQQHNLPWQQQPDHNGQMVNSQELSTANFNAAWPPMQCNLSDSNISRNKQPASRPLEEQRNNKLLSSSSAV